MPRCVGHKALTSLLAGKGILSQPFTTHVCPVHQGSSEGGARTWKQGWGPIAEAALLGPTAQSLGKSIPGNQQRAQITGRYQIAQPSPTENKTQTSHLILLLHVSQGQSASNINSR